MTESRKILVISRDPGLADVRKNVLEKAGFQVLTAVDANAVEAACERDKLLLVMLGHSLLPSEKRKVWAAVKEHCEIPVLELHSKTGPELMSPAYFHESQAPDDFLKSVMKIVGKAGRKSKK